MTPTARDSSTPGQHNGTPFGEDAVVISGISCVMPDCHDIMEFSDKLYGKVNMAKCGKSRWTRTHPDLPKYHGTIPQVDRFDAQFFMVFHSLGQTMDAMSRKLLEHSYQAVFDAGVCPTELSGKSIGVFISTGFCETDKASIVADSHFGILGSNRAMSANRISYFLNLKGPSMHLDGDAAGSALALEKAYVSITSGQCEAAIVGTAKLLLHPHTSLNHHKLLPFCPDGNVKSYDEKADGHVLSEGLTVIFLQKHKDAKRVYASLRHIKTAFFSTNNEAGIQNFSPYRDPEVLAKFFSDFYEEIEVSPIDVDYVEGFGSAVPDADKAKLQAIDKVFCKNRKIALPVGSVMSNVGYTESASCITGIMKLILAYHKGKIASNINCDTPRQDIEAVREGRLLILTEDANFRPNFAAINNFSITGINVHVLLQGYYKRKDPLKYQSNIPYLMTVSGRQESSVKKILDNIKSRPLDPEEITLLHNIHRIRIPKHLARGFGIYSTSNKQETVTLKEKVDYYDDEKRPLWFVYSGMGSQWVEMGVQLMRIPIFAGAILKCHKALEPKGIDLTNIITRPDGCLFDDILNSFVGIAAIQVGLTDVLTAIGLVPDNIIGHSVGELGCAYADGCVTAEEMVLMAYSRGLVSKQTPFIRGSMAAVGIGFKQISNVIPPEIEVACHNGPDSCTISGPADIMKTFVAQLSAQGIFAKEVPCSNIAYHSRYISKAGPGLLNLLKEVVKSPKTRSKRWLSTSVPQDKWNEPIAKYSSAEYHTNNLLSPVLFEETIKLIPYNAVLIEIAPHGLLQAILKRSLPETCRNIPLTRRGHKDNAMFLLEAIGKLYMEGFDVNLSALYPKIEFPVSTETKPLSHLIEWAYAEKYKICQYVSVDKKTNAVYRPIITIHDKEYEYLSGNIINGNIVFPFSAALVLVWDLIAMTEEQKRRHLSVQFKDITCHVQPLLSNKKPLYLTVLLQRGSGRFEVTNDQRIIVDGYVNAINKSSNFSNGPDTKKFEIELANDDIYKLLFERGYQYRNDFRSIRHANFSFTHANLIWNDNWVAFLDGLFQMNVLRRSHRGISQPQYIKRICIDVMDHMKYVGKSKNKEDILSATYSEIYKVTRCGGISIEHLIYKDKPSLLPQRALLKEKKFIPFNQDSNNCGIWGGEYFIPIKDEKINSDAIALEIDIFGDLNTLTWVDRSNEIGHDTTIKVHYAGLNVYDAKRAIAEISIKDDNHRGFGMDFSGVTERGDRVMGVIKREAVSTQVSAQPELLWPVPEHWTLEDAATVPLPYCLAFYCLAIKSKLLRKLNVLIHGGTGALGQAAISICLANGCNVFTTVSTVHKKKFLRKLFPDLPDSHIGNSRDTTFQNMVVRGTKGEGCHIVICSVSGELKETTLKCCKFLGITVDTVHIHTQENFVYGMKNMDFLGSYAIIDFASIFTNNNKDQMKLLQLMVSEGIAKGYVRPLSRVTYAPGDIPRAFRLLSGSRHYGRVLINIENGIPLIQPRISCSHNACHLIFCDKDNIGLQLVEKLVNNGTKNLFIHSERPSSYLEYKISLWRKRGVQIHVSYESICKMDQVMKLLKDCTRWAPVEGIFIVKTELNDTKSYKKAENLIFALDSISKDLCPSLRYFAVIHENTSKCLGREICMKRTQQGLPFSSLCVCDLEKFDEKELATDYDKTLWAGDATKDLSLKWAFAVDGIERAILSKKQNIIVYAQPIRKSSTIEEVINITGVKITDTKSTFDDTTLEEVGIDRGKAQELCNVLEKILNITISKEDVPLMTISTLKTLLENKTHDGKKKLNGLNAFINTVDSDELLTDCTVQIRTLVNTSELRHDEFDNKLEHLCIIPGLEGLRHRFQKLCERLKIPALVLQPGFDINDMSVKNMAQRLTQVMTTKLNLGEHFYLLGYEIGVLIVMEMAQILEDRGLTGTVFCVGGTPEDICTILQAHFSNTDPEQLQNELIELVYTLFTKNKSDDLNMVIKKAKDWKDKVEICIQMIQATCLFSKQYLRSYMNVLYNRIYMARDYVWKRRPLKSKIVVLKARFTAPYCESKYDRQIAVHELNESLPYALEDLKCSDIVNKYLDSKILEDYNNMNHCETVLINEMEDLVFNYIDDD